MKKILLDGEHLTIEAIQEIAHHHDIEVGIDPEARERLKRSRFFIEEAVESGDVIYGVTTGFGNFKKVAIKKNRLIPYKEI